MGDPVVRYLVITKPPPDEFNYNSVPVYTRTARFCRGRRTYLDQKRKPEVWVGLQPPTAKPAGIAQVRNFHLGQVLFVGDSDQEVIHPYTKIWKHGPPAYEIYAKLFDALRRSDRLANGDKSRRGIGKPIKIHKGMTDAEWRSLR
ncbi:MAG: hypothetical protein ACRD1X_22135 [Vicinamibacteria bacterium]